MKKINICNVLKRKTSILFYLIKDSMIKISYFGISLFYYQKSSRKVYLKNRDKGLKYYEKRYAKTKKYIMKRYGDMILNCKPANEVSNISENSPIWICWWQGEKQAPDLVNSCISSIKKYAGNHPVNVITLNNYKNYVDIPEILFEKAENGKISYTHLSDLLRCKLLYKYGGIWCDATLYLTDFFDSQIYLYPFYSIKHDFRYIRELEVEPSKCRWRTFFLAVQKENPIFKVCSEILCDWLMSDVPLVDYFTIDYIIWLLYEKNEFIKNIINNVPYNNIGTYRLGKLLNDTYDENLWNEIKNENYIHKLSHKIKLEHGSNTFYSVIVKNNN